MKGDSKDKAVIQYNFRKKGKIAFLLTVIKNAVKRILLPVSAYNLQVYFLEAPDFLTADFFFPNCVKL